jgi:ribonucleoside-diphosphate reductase alpha chain
MNTSQKILSDIIVYNKYARYSEEMGRRETWDEIVTRNMEMHIRKFPKMEAEIKRAYALVYNKKVLPSMRSLQFGGKAIELNNARLFNCSYMPVDSYHSFSEAFFLLLSGCGVGYSVQAHHVSKLPAIKKPTKSKKYMIGDDIIGWADSVKALLKAFMGKSSYDPIFDFRSIRKKGEQLKTSGGKAPGPGPLRVALSNVRAILETKEDGEQLTPLECHDIMCHIADAVLAGGIRRSAMISLFDRDDNDMLTCKFGNWWEVNPQRGRANNSAVLVRGDVGKEEFMELWKKVEQSNSGEPGFYWTNDTDWGTNPCCEIALRPYQFCNLVEVNGSDIEDQIDLNNRLAAAAVIGTIQASYTDFHYLRDIWRQTTELDSLVGIGMTGIASNAIEGLDLKLAVEIAKLTNDTISEDIGINKAARMTCVKPSGTSSIVLGTSSGIHAWHDEYYIRRVRVGKEEALYKYLETFHPEILEDDAFSPSTMSVISIPQSAPAGSVTSPNETSLEFLSRIAKMNEEWIKPGHTDGANSHNISATVSVGQEEWAPVGEWLWDNQESYNGLSFLPRDLGTYTQAPFESISKEQYEEMSSVLHGINPADIKEDGDYTDLKGEAACAGGACEIK